MDKPVTAAPRNPAMALAFVKAASGKRLDGRKAIAKGINGAVRQFTNGEVKAVK